MTLVGADVSRLRDLADSFDHAADQLDAVVPAIDGPLSVVPWAGTDLEAFRDAWGDLAPRVRAAADSLREAGRRARANADEQEAASAPDNSAPTAIATPPDAGLPGEGIPPTVQGARFFATSARDGDVYAPDKDWHLNDQYDVERIPNRNKATRNALAESWDDTAEYMSDEMNRNPSIFNKEMADFEKATRGAGGSHGSAYAAQRYALFYTYVKSGGEWDHKGPIRYDIIDGNLKERSEKKSDVHDTYLPVPGQKGVNLSYDVWSNIHYGFVGRHAGFSEGELTAGQYAAEGVDDRADQISIEIGYELAKKYQPGEITPEILEKAIIDHLDEYEAAARETGSSQYRGHGDGFLYSHHGLHQV